MWQELLKGRLFGHPVHPMLVHFPTALFSAGFLFDIGGIIINEPPLFLASFYVIILGVGIGLLAAIFGFMDFIKLAARPDIFRVASLHGGIQFVVLTVFGIVGGLKFQTYPNVKAPDFFLLIVTGVALAAMLAGNYLGGELVFTHRVGIKEDR